MSDLFGIPHDEPTPIEGSFFKGALVGIALSAPVWIAVIRWLLSR